MTKTFLALLAAASLATACLNANEASELATVSAAQCSAASAWAPGTTYAVGTVVSFSGGMFQCRQAHRSQADWTPTAVPALWGPVACGGGGGGGGGGSGGGGTGGGTGDVCDPNAWVYMASDASACEAHLGESCGWTTGNQGQGYHCQTTSWGTGCEPGGTTCPNGTGGGGGSGGSGGGTASGLVFGPYKDTSINMNWNTSVVSTNVSGSPTPIATDLKASGGKTITLAFATGECGNESWGGIPGLQMAQANAALLSNAGVDYILSTGGAAGAFSCGSDAGMATFLNRWKSSHLVGLDLDIEAGQSQAVIEDLVRRTRAAHTAFPGLRMSLTIATLANNNGGPVAKSLGAGVQESLSVHGVQTLNAVKSVLGWNGQASTWPSFLTVNLMTMDYGSPGAGVCVVANGVCDMGQSALQAAFNLHDRWNVPFSNIELTPMIGGNDVQSEHYTLADVDTTVTFAKARGLAGVHYWSYDRDVDCAPGAASPICNSLGGAGAHGFLRRFLADGLH